MTTRLFSLVDLEYFVVVCDSGSFARGSERLHKARSNVSDQIALLEHRIGKQLLTRNHLGVTPTKDGLVLYRYATKVLQAAAEAETSIRNRSAA